jgi:hypothetical protein
MQNVHLSRLHCVLIGLAAIGTLADGGLSASSAQPAPRRAMPIKGALEVVLSSAGTVDWAAGELRVQAVGLADRRAPTPDIARPAALARAESKARELLMTELTKLPWADGKTVAEHLTLAQRSEAVALASVTLATPQVDGGWQITITLPLEIVRQLAQGPREVTGGNSERTAATELIIDARALPIVPALGLGIRSGNVTVDCPIRWQRSKAGGNLAHGIKADSVRDGIVQAKLSNEIKLSSVAVCIVVIGAP